MIFDSTSTARSTSDLFIRVAAMNEAATAEQRPPALRVIGRLTLASVWSCIQETANQQSICANFCAQCSQTDRAIIPGKNSKQGDHCC
jgi:hypothetical protein